MCLHLEEAVTSAPQENATYASVLTSASDLVTSYAATRAGFIRLALEKNRIASPYVEAARALQDACRMADSATGLKRIEGIRAGLLAASGLSDKALKRLQPADHEAAIDELIKNFLEPAGANFVEELVFRFLLNRGDTVGGSMRNIAGVLAQRKFTRALLSTLAVAGIAFQWSNAKLQEWREGDPTMPDIESELRGLHWRSDQGERTLIFNLTVPTVRKNVDLCLFGDNPETLTRDRIASPSSYIALGELKGGIDPAGADEHWKTARSALNRIRQSFSASGGHPLLFFVAAAIEQSMATEIWHDLQQTDLHFAANLNVDQQLFALTRWLSTL